MKYLENLYKIAPKLKIDGNNTGSCVVLKENETIYILTAKHCLQNLISNISLDFYDISGDEFVSYNLENNDYETIISDESIDLVILRIKSGITMPNIPIIRLAKEVFATQKQFFIQGFLTGNDFRRPEKISVHYTDLDENGFRVGTNEKLDDEVCNAVDNVEGLSGSGVFFTINNEIYLVGITKKFTGKIQRFIIIDFEKVAEQLPELKIYNEDEIPFESPNIELSRDFKRQLSEAEEYVYNFKPITAQTKVERLRKVIELSSLPQKDKTQLLIESDYINAIALINLEKDIPKSSELLINAYNVFPDNPKYRERAASAYFLKDNDKSLQLVNEVLKENSFNPRAWALKNALSNYTLEIPSFVLDKPRFIYNNMVLRLGQAMNKIEDLQPDFGHLTETVPTPTLSEIDYDSFNYYLFLGIYFIDSGNNGYRIIGQESNKVTPKVKKGAEILEVIFKKISTTELKETHFFKQAEFFFEHSKYKINPKERQANRLYDLFIDDEFTSTKMFKAFDIAFALFDHKLYKQVIEVIEKSEIEKNDLSFYLLRAAALKALGKIDDSKKYYVKFLEEIKHIDIIALRNSLGTITSLQELYDESVESDYLYKLLQGKTHGKPYYQDLLNGYILRLNPDKKGECAIIAQNLSNSFWGELEFNEKIIVISIFVGAGEFEKAITYLKPILDFEKEHPYLDNYIDFLWISGGYTSELLLLLEKWRLNFSPMLKFLNYELKLYNTIDNYPKIEEICSFGLEKFRDNKVFKYDLIRALYKQDKLLDLDILLNDSLLNLNFPTDGMFFLSRVCLTVNKIDLGLKLAYNELKKYPQNIDVQMSYWKIFIFSESKISILNPKIIELDTVVELEIDGESELFDVTQDSFNSNPIIEKIYNQKLGDVVQIKTEYQDNIVTIKAIYDKYLGELKKIMFKVDKPLAGGLPLESIQFAEDNDDNFNLESFEEKLKKKYGQKGLLRKIELDKVIEQYQKKEIGFSGLCQSLFYGNPFDCFESIIKDVNLGVNIIPLISQHPFQRAKETEFVLDFTTILLFHWLSEEIDFKGYRFYISQSTKDIAINYLRELRSSQKEKMSLSILPDKVVPIFYPDNYVEKKLERMMKILQWIDDYCTVDYIDNFLDDEDMINAIPSELDRRYLLNTLLIANKPNRILVTDDTFYFLNPIIPVITSEHLFKSVDSQLWEIAKCKMIQLNYKGLTLTQNTLSAIFDKSRVIIKSNTLLFQNALKSLPGSHNPNKSNLDEAIGFIKYIYSIPLDKSQRIMITKQVFIAILKEHYFDLTSDNFRLIYSKIDISLNLLGDAPNIVKNSFEEVRRDLFGDSSRKYL